MTYEYADITDDPTQCACGLGPGMNCHPHCPSYIKPPPTEISGKVELDAKTFVRTREEIALKASYISVAVTATDTVPQQLLGQDNQRKRAVVVSDTGILLAKKEQAMSGMRVGFALPANTALEMQNQDELWVIPTGVAAVVSVLNERWS